MKKLISDLTIIIWISIFSQFAGADEWGTIKIPWSKPITIAFDEQLEMQFVGIKRGIEMAFKEKASLLGYPLRFDSKTSKYGSFKSDHLPQIFCNNAHNAAVIGYADNTDLQSALEIHHRQKVVLLTPLNIGTQPLEDKNPIIFSLCCSYKIQARKAAEFSLSRKKHNIAVIYNKDENSQKLGRHFSEQVQVLGGKVLFETSLSSNYYLSEMIEKIKTIKCDLIYYAGPYELGISAIEEMDAVGLHHTYFIAGAACNNGKFLRETSGIPIANCYVIAPRKPSREWTRNFEAQYGLKPGFGHYGYDAAQILIRALKAVTYKNSDGGLVIGKKALAFAVKHLNFKGASGKIEFDLKGCRTSSAIAIYHVFDNEEEGLRFFKETPFR
jgi:ABC-type branched-subunit amino acid transport system substrate-binding protein